MCFKERRVHSTSSAATPTNLMMSNVQSLRIRTAAALAKAKHEKGKKATIVLWWMARRHCTCACTGL